MKSTRQLQTEVAWACRILAMENQGDLSLGHVSARYDSRTVYMKRRGLGLGEVTANDVIPIDLQGRQLEPAENGQGVHLEFPLHTEVYKLRPDVGAVIHAHPIHAIALGATSEELKMINHDAVLFYDGLPRFNDSPDLITGTEQGQAVARALGSARALLLCNHGTLVVGKDVRWAIVTALTLERAIQLQLIATRLGDLTHVISASEAEALFPKKYQDAFIDDYWEYLIRRARRVGEDVS
ncbi:MAG: class II aldolase/adducin family protein [Candidatus Bipolaricaulia bacterium]